MTLTLSRLLHDHVGAIRSALNRMRYHAIPHALLVWSLSPPVTRQRSRPVQSRCVFHAENLVSVIDSYSVPSDLPTPCSVVEDVLGGAVAFGTFPLPQVSTIVGSCLPLLYATRPNQVGKIKLAGMPLCHPHILCSYISTSIIVLESARASKDSRVRRKRAVAERVITRPRRDGHHRGRSKSAGVDRWSNIGRQVVMLQHRDTLCTRKRQQRRGSNRRP
jgi:hypothetical protein